MINVGSWLRKNPSGTFSDGTFSEKPIAEKRSPVPWMVCQE